MWDNLSINDYFTLMPYTFYSNEKLEKKLHS